MLSKQRVKPPSVTLGTVPSPPKFATMAASPRSTSPELELKALLAEEPRSFSFSCGGWLKMYLFGVAKALQEHELDKGARLIGCSAGSLAATGLAIGCNFDDIRDFVLQNAVTKAHASWHGPFNCRQYLTDTVNATGQLHRFEELNTDPARLAIVYTSLSSWATRRITTFDSPDHVMKCLMASCCATPIVGMPFKLKGEWVMDGGVLDFQPVFDENTITVNPFYCARADITPSRYVPMWWAVYPPSQRDVEWLFDLGYEDGLNWIVKSGLARGKKVVIPTKGADYDGKWTTTVGQVLGYRGLESRVLDVLFVGLYVCLWKPIVFFLLYVELYLRAIVCGSKAAVFGAAAKLMITSILIVVSMLVSATHESITVLLALNASSIFLSMLVLCSGGIHEAASVATKDWQQCRSCLRNITSLSLFLRSLPVLGSSVTIKRHEHLLQHSLIYRLTFHLEAPSKRKCSPARNGSVAAEDEQRSFSFACGGWLQMYLFGVCKALQEYGLEENAQLIGCSAGALAATALALKCDFDLVRSYINTNIVTAAHASWGGPFNVRSYLIATLAKTGGLHRYAQLNTTPSKVTIVYTSLSAWASRRVSHFDSEEQLHKSLLASCCATPIAGFPFKLKGEWVMDGGVFDFQPVLNDKTICVSPFYCTRADIKPSRYVPMWWAIYPPSQRDVEWLFHLGYEDGLTWIAKSGLAGGKTIDIPTRGKTYDGEWTTTVGQVFGYRGVESRVLDVMFVCLYVCICKPLAFLLLYLELYLHAIVSGGKAMLFGAAAKLMISTIVILVTMAALATHSLQDTMMFLFGLVGSAVLLGLLALLAGGLQEAANVASKDWKKCRTCLRNITSLSLFLRSLPVFGSSAPIKRHEFLLQHSLDYRLTVHFLLSVDENTGEIQVQKYAIAFLQEIADPIIVVSLHGAQGNGKTTLLHKLLVDVDEAAAAAGAHNPAAQDHSELPERGQDTGVWLYVKRSTYSNVKYVAYLDRQGFGNNHELDVLLYSLLLGVSSVAIHYVVGDLTTEAIEQFAFLGFNPETEEHRQPLVFPHGPKVMWMMQNVSTSELKERYGKAAATAEMEQTYVREVLGNQAPGTAVGQFCDQFLAAFPDQSCFPMPAFDSTAFVKRSEKLNRFIVESGRNRYNKGVLLNGPLLGSLLVSMLAHQNSIAQAFRGKIWRETIHNCCLNIVESGIKIYKLHMAEQLPGIVDTSDIDEYTIKVAKHDPLPVIDLPCEVAVLNDIHLEAKRRAKRNLRTMPVRAGKLSDLLKKLFKDLINSLYNKIQEENNLLSSKLCREVLQDLHIRLTQKMEQHLQRAKEEGLKEISVQSMEFKRFFRYYQTYLFDLIGDYTDQARGPMKRSELSLFCQNQVREQLEELTRKVHEVRQQDIDLIQQSIDNREDDMERYNDLQRKFQMDSMTAQTEMNKKLVEVAKKQAIRKEALEGAIMNVENMHELATKQKELLEEAAFVSVQLPCEKVIEAAQDTETTHLQGYLIKQGGGGTVFNPFGRQNWKQRYFILTGNSLIYAKTKDDYERGFIIKEVCLTGCKIEPSRDAGEGFDIIPPDTGTGGHVLELHKGILEKSSKKRFSQADNGRIFKLRAQSIEERDKWIETLRRVASSSSIKFPTCINNDEIWSVLCSKLRSKDTASAAARSIPC
ncbi:TPA: hypothetical protein N0F65_010380 [Lagenidium giganteum]|uniref:Uncharacterized protein n=1 Tax=Lagenidium giganteum TaxID=4803 RepID=A0AAV2YJM7_9STRA|nr:TPA: hypothetical protein N0F65_010380 [Lagenidium giganteum]